MVDKNEEAARWFAASRRGVMLYDEREAYDVWRRDPENAAYLAELQAVWNELEPRPAAPDSVETPARQDPVSHRRQVAAMVAFMSLTATVLTRIDGGWWNTLDWWSR
jgi:ferric-dicitrate binding protein FerR (iron transport regulator)